MNARKRNRKIPGQSLMKNRTAWLCLGYTLLAVQVILLAGVSLLLRSRSGSLNSDELRNVFLDWLGMFVLILQYLSMVRVSRPMALDQYMMGMILAEYFYLFTEAVYWMIAGRPENRIPILINETLYCLCPLALSLLFWYLIRAWTDREKRRRTALDRVVDSLAALGTLLLLGNLFGGYYFRIDPPSGAYIRGSLFSVRKLVVMLILSCCVIQILLERLPWREKVVFLSFPLAPMAVTVFSWIQAQPTLVSISAFCMVTFVYTNLYTRRNMELLSRRQALTESRLRGLQAQLNPHFFYNALASVSGLCETDPKAAETLIGEISAYLRSNVTQQDQDMMTGFEDEMENVRHYVHIVKTRFPSLKVEYDLQAVDFELPRMTLQPLVENAIRHGMKRRFRGEGTVTISTVERPEAWVVTVADDGEGFMLPLPEDGEKHVGISNVRTRLEMLCGGRLEINSAPGRGTVCTIRIPRWNA